MNQHTEKLKVLMSVYENKYKNDDFGNPISFKYLESQGLTLSSDFWEWFLQTIDKYSYTLTTLPSWAGDYKSIKIGKYTYTHIAFDKKISC